MSGKSMLQILEERYERKSVIIASQLPIAKWYDYIGDPTLADAIAELESWYRLQWYHGTDYNATCGTDTALTSHNPTLYKTQDFTGVPIIPLWIFGGH